MRWILICCFLLASARDILTTTPSTTVRPKRDLMSIKNFMLSKLFGSDTVVIPLPNIPKGETYQLFKIKGYDNVFLKVTRKPKYKEVENIIKLKYGNPGLINPEMAILGHYLGTNSERETLMALDMVKNLVKSEILTGEREETIQKVVVPMVSTNPFKSYLIREHVKPVELVKEEIPLDPFYLQHHVPSVVEDEGFGIVNHRPIAIYPAEYPRVLVGSEVKYRPLQTKFSYKQETDDADMTYESYNNHGVIVTRTNKVPVKPKYISLRLADVASIAANPFLTKSRKTTTTTISGDNLKETLKVMPIHSYVTKDTTRKEIQATQTTTTACPEIADELSGYDDSANSNEHPTSFDIYPPNIYESTNAPEFIKDSKVPFDIRDHLTDVEIEKLNRFINEKLSKSNEAYTPKPFDENEPDVDLSDDKKRAAGSDQIKTGKNVSSYDIEHDIPVVKIENHKLKQSDINEIKYDDKLLQHYIYVPPTSGYVPPLPIANAINTDILPPMPNVKNIVYVQPVTPSTKNVKTNVEIPNADNFNTHSDSQKYDYYESHSEIYPKTSVTITSTARQTRPGGARNPEQLRTNTRHSWSQNPIVIPELEDKQNKATSNATITTSSKKTFIGGRKTNMTTKHSSTFTGGPVV